MVAGASSNRARGPRRAVVRRGGTGVRDGQSGEACPPRGRDVAIGGGGLGAAPRPAVRPWRSGAGGRVRSRRWDLETARGGW